MDIDHSAFVTDTNKTPLIQNITWFLLASAVICTLCRAYTKYAVIRFIGLDDYFVPIALLFLVGQSVAITIQTTSGYGKPMVDLTSYQVTTILQAEYAAMLLYIPSLFFSKLPALIFLNLISPIQQFRQMLLGTAIIILGWTLSSELVSAFQCRPSNAWDYLSGQCVDRMAFLLYFEAMNAFTDAILVLLPLGFICYVRTSLRRKISVTVVFCARLLPLGVSLAKIVVSLPSSTSTDPLFDTWPATICTQLIQFLSLMSACILYLRPFLEALTSGFINGDEDRRRGQIRPYVLVSNDLATNLVTKAEDTINNGYTLPSQDASRDRREEIRTFRGRRGSDGELTSAAGGSKSVGFVGSRWPKDNENGQRTAKVGISRAGSLDLPHWTLPIGENGLPRMSIIHSPLETTDGIQSFLASDEH